jgi:predicted subunit of tRNA(5-methylaminomethyl-2-thiouridylate) methyltransferase
MDFHSHGELGVRATQDSPSRPFEERHYPVAYWAQLWGFSAKTVREWFHNESGPGILRQQKSGRRKKRDYTTLMISATAARRVYAKHTQSELIH